MKKIKIATILGTRPEIIRLARVLSVFDKFFNHKIIFTSQSYDYEMSNIFFEEMDLRRPDHILQVRADTLGKQIGNILSQTEEVLIKESPDAVLILGDTNTALTAIIAKRLKVPIFHMEAGNRSFDWNVPEEINRRIVDHISDYNLAYTEHSRRYLLSEGIDRDKVFVTGSPLAEVFAYYRSRIDDSKILDKIGVSKEEYFIVSAHREENVENDNKLIMLAETLNEIAVKYKKKVIVSLHPRTAKRIELKKIKFHKLVILHKPFGYFDYNKLQKNSYCAISDSGTIQEESAILQFPAIQIRVSTERPEAFDAGSIIVCGLEKDSVISSIEIAVASFSANNGVPTHESYKELNVSDKVVRIVQGLTSIKKSSK